MKVEDISQDPGTIPDADLSYHRIRLLALPTEMHKVHRATGESVF